MMIDQFRGKYGPFSNFWVLSTPIILPELIGPADNYQYHSVENAFQAAKTLDMNDRYDISKMSAKKAKAKGKLVTMRLDWESIKRPLMLGLVRQKFYNSQALGALLVSTGGEVLIEGNYWHDNYWGNCYCDKCQNIEGRNWLGKILMHIRKEI